MKEIELKINVYGSEALRRKAKLVKKVTQRHKDVLSQMAQLMYASSGIGLAAPQVGISEAMIVADIGTGLYKIINPRIIRREGSQSTEEGCLSLPGVCIKIKRARRVVVEGIDQDGIPLSIESEELLATVFQHEIDHLHGTLIVDHASMMQRLKLKPKLLELARRARHERTSSSEGQSCQLQL
jgi:peptide deformylase